MSESGSDDDRASTDSGSVWFVQIANNYGQNKEYDEKERDMFRHDPKSLVAHAKVSHTLTSFLLAH